MKKHESYMVILFESPSATLLAEKILKQASIPFKIIPMPRHISSNCGVCIRFAEVERERIQSILTGKVDIQDITPL